MIIGTTDINKDPGLGRTMGPDMVPGYSLDLDITMALGGSKAYPYLYDPGGSMALRHQYDLSVCSDPGHAHSCRW